MRRLKNIISIFIAVFILSTLASAQAFRSNGPHDPQSTELPSACSTAYDWARRGDFRTGCRDCKQAVKDYTEAIRLDPNLVTAYLCRGDNYFDLKEYRSALADYSKVLEFTPNDTLTLDARANTKWQLDDCAGAVCDTSRSIALSDATSSELLAFRYEMRAGRRLFMRQYKLAKIDCDKSIILNPRNPRIFSLRGETFAEMHEKGHLENAIKDFDQALSLSPGDAEISRQRALARFWSGDVCAAFSDRGLLLLLSVVAVCLGLIGFATGFPFLIAFGTVEGEIK